MMSNIAEEIKNNVMASVIMFPPLINGKVEFLVYDKIKAANNYIKFTAIVNLSQKKEFNHKLELKLLKLTDDPSKYMTFRLADIYLNREDNMKIYKGKSEENKDIKGDDYKIKNNIRYSFNNVPVLGTGEYALSVGFDFDNEFIPLNSFYFSVE